MNFFSLAKQILVMNFLYDVTFQHVWSVIVLGIVISIYKFHVYLQKKCQHILNVVANTLWPEEWVIGVGHDFNDTSHCNCIDHHTVSP